MLRSVAVREVQRYAGHRTDGESDIIELMQLGQADLELNWPKRPLPWFLVSERLSTSTVGDEERVALPTGFIEEYEQDAVWYVDENGGEHLLRKYDADDLRRYDQVRTGYNTITPPTRAPVQYARTGHYFRLFPKPDAVYSLKFMAYIQDDALTTDIENLWLKYAPYVIIGWAGEKFCAANRDGDGVALCSTLKQNAMDRLDTQSIEHEMANRRMQMGETA